jgi:site-specific recombinase XerD
MNEDILDEYLSKLIFDGRSESTIYTARCIIKNFFIWYGDRDIKSIAKADINKYIAYLTTTEFPMHGHGKTKKKLEPSSIFQKKSAIRQFLKWLYKEYPEEVKDLTSVIELKTIKRRELPQLIQDDELRRMIETSQNPRDKALIAFLYDSGCRRGEMLGIKNKHIKFMPDGCCEVLVPKGKTTTRRILLIWSSQYIHTWKSNHPLKDDPEAYFFCSLRSPFGKFSKTGLWEQLKLIAKRADISHNIHPHLFRHTRATNMASEGYSNQEMNAELGWTAGSTMFNTYVQLSGVCTDNKKRKLAGLPIMDEIKSGMKTVECPRCHRICPAEVDRCAVCMMAISEAAKKEDWIEEELKKKELMDSVEIMVHERLEEQRKEMDEWIERIIKKSPDW